MVYKIIIVYTLIGAAVIMDKIYYRIPNSINIWGLVTAIFLNLYIEDNIGMYHIVLGILIPFGLLYPIFLVGGIGAGDVKLMCVIGCIMGSYKILEFTILCFMISGVLGIIKLIFQRNKKKKNNLYLLSKIHFSYGIFIGSIVGLILDNLMRE